MPSLGVMSVMVELPLGTGTISPLDTAVGGGGLCFVGATAFSPRPAVTDERWRSLDTSTVPIGTGGAENVMGLGAACPEEACWTVAPGIMTAARLLQ